MTVKKYILAGRLIDGSGSAAQKSVFLVVVDGVITAVKKSEDFDITGKDGVVDLSHCTIMPPLIDCSLKLSHSAATDMGLRQENLIPDFEVNAKIIRQNIHFCHSHGVLGGVNTDDIHGSIHQFKEANVDTDSFEIVATGGVQQEEKDYLRLIYTSGIEAEAESMDFRHVLSTKELNEHIRKNHRHKAVVLANGEAAVRDAMDAGCGALEQGYFMGEQNLEEMAKNEVLWIPTVLIAKTHMDWSTGKRRAYFRAAVENQLWQLKKAGELGVKIALGTGSGISGIIHGDSMVEEMKQYLKAGLSLLETLRCASVCGAQFFSMKNCGVLKVGHAATFIVSRGMVQQLPRKLSYLEDIYIQGEPSKAYRKNPVKTVYKK